MEIHNYLPVFVKCLRRWEKAPSAKVFNAEYYDVIRDMAAPMMADFSGYLGADFHSVIADLDWPAYRAEAMTLNPEHELGRVRRYLQSVESLFGVKAQGEVVLLGAFTMMDGYARFDEGRHRVFLGMDESHAKGKYLDVLVAHELTHVIRESRATVWEGFGLNPKMTHDEFRENQPVIEHVFSEGFSCAISERLVPGEPAWSYAYQDQESLATVLEHGPALDKAIHAELRNPDGDFGRLYRIGGSLPGEPSYVHYVWAWQWVKRLIAEVAGGDPAKLIGTCSKEFLEHALAFRLTGLS